MDTHTVTPGSSGTAADASQPVQPSQHHYPTTGSRSVSPTMSRSDNSKYSTVYSSGTSSPLASRDPSPNRPNARSNNTRSAIPGPRSRKNSQQELSPSRVPKPNPSASALPGAQPQLQLQGASKTISAASIPTLLPAAPDAASSKQLGPQKSSASNADPRDGPRWPISPRLRSPPPQLNRPLLPGPRRSDQDAPVVNHQRVVVAQPSTESLASESDTEEPLLHSGIRTPAHNTTLETVQEVSLPNSPHPPTNEAMEQVKEKLASELALRAEGISYFDSRTLKAKVNPTTAESGSESGSIKTEGRRSAAGAYAPPLMSRQSSSMSTKQTRPLGSTEGVSRNMTVETETVTSVPQVTVAPTTSETVRNGTLKTKHSSETIKPKKERKKNSRKQSTVNAGNASSKAEIFEATVASAVHEAEDSDSEETFVYDSNPPDGPRRFHSRTPSATSMASQADRNIMRSIRSVMESGPTSQPTAVKKNMKFVNTFAAGGLENLASGDDDGKGINRSNAGSARGTTRHHYHIGRWGRSQSNGHASLFDNESPFPIPNAARTKMASNNSVSSRNGSGPTSPRYQNSGRSTANGGAKRAGPMDMPNSYDLDDTTGADDERTPLIHPSPRLSRSMRGRRVLLSQRQLEAQSFRNRSSYLNRFAACLVVTMMMLLVITGAIGFMFATSQPLSDIELVAIQNVLASEPELMFDLTVKAHNPNIVVVTIDSANIEIFAKSPRAGTDSEWWQHPDGPRLPMDGDSSDVHIDAAPYDKSDDDSAPNMRLGTIAEFDSPLTFEGSFFHKGMSSSTGGMRLHLPGNSTAGGSLRWGRVIQSDFDLIVKGILKYSLPLSHKVRSAPISGRTTVKPNAADDPDIVPSTTRPGDS